MRIVRTIVGAAGTAAVLAALGAGGPAQAAGCQAAFTESRGPSALTVAGTTCATARKVAAQVAAAAPSGCIVASGKGRGPRLRAPCVRLRYRCSATTGKRGSLRVTCTRGAARIRFTY